MDFRLWLMPQVLAFAVLAAPGAESFECDFKTADEKLPDCCHAVDGLRISAFKEDRTWNPCLRCEVSQAYTNEAKGTVSWTGAAWIGGTKEVPGVQIEPAKNYDVAFDLRGNGVRLSVKVWVWTGPDFYKDRQRINLVVPGPATTAEWKTYRAKFKAPEGALRAAIGFSIWGDTGIRKTGNPSVGDWFLVDNVSIRPSRKNLGATAVEPDPVEPRKILPTSTGEWTDDFLSLETRRSAESPMAMSAKVDGDALLLMFRLGEDARGHVRGTAKSPWSGDAVELFFELPDGKLAHFAFNEAGARYTDLGGGAVACDDWSLRTAAEGSKWGAKVRIPFRLLDRENIPADGEEIRFNAARFRKNARGNDVWGNVRQEFNETDRYGRIVFGSLATAVRREFGVDRHVPDAAAYRKTCAEIEAARLKAKFEKFANSKVAVAVVPVIGDYTIPYLPEEIFDPIESISVRAAVNEVKAVPVAIANLTERSEDYMVVLETKDRPFVGERGLKGFPQENLTVRKALKIRDSYVDSPTLRFDPLPVADQTCSVTVAPKEAGLVWFDFDTAGVRPGTYEGRLRVIPLCEKGVLSRIKGKSFGDLQYTGEMKDIPFTLTVDPIELPRVTVKPSEFYNRVDSDEAYDLVFALGGYRQQLSTWGIPATGLSEQVKRNIRDDTRRAAKYGARPLFGIEYSAYKVFKTAHQPRAGGNVTWADYIRMIYHEMQAMGVKDSEYYIEIDDETTTDRADEIAEACRIAKEAAPNMQLSVTLGGWIIPTEKIMAIARNCDVFVMWRHGYVENPKLNREVIQKLREMGRTIVHYSCETAMSLDLHTYYRLHPWIAERYGLDGSGIYQLCTLEGGVGARDFKTPTYGEILYHMYNRPVPSVRFMAYREGVTDIRYLDALRARLPDDLEVKAFLKRASEEVFVRGLRGQSAPDRLREEARRLLLRKRRPGSSAGPRRAEFVVHGDGTEIQRAIDEAAAAGGGCVVVTPGLHPSGSLRLRSNVELHLAKGACIVGRTKSEDYFAFPKGVCSICPEKSSRVFVYAWDEHDIAITGEGTIDGQGPKFFDPNSRQWERFWAKPECERPRMVQFVRCRGVRLEGATFLDSPGWTMLIRLCENVHVERIRVKANQMMINSDGIDIDGCRHVRIADSDFTTGDDSVVLRAMRERGCDARIVCEDVVVENCRMNSACQCVRVGCPSDDTIRNVSFRNVDMAGHNGICFDNPVVYLKEGDEGYLNAYDMVFENITGNVWGQAVRIDVDPGIKLRGIRNVLFKNMTVESGETLRFTENIHTRFENVRFENVRFQNVCFNGIRQKDGEVPSDCTADGKLKRD